MGMVASRVEYEAGRFREILVGVYRRALREPSGRVKMAVAFDALSSELRGVLNPDFKSSLAKVDGNELPPELARAYTELVTQTSILITEARKQTNGVTNKMVPILEAAIRLVDRVATDLEPETTSI